METMNRWQGLADKIQFVLIFQHHHRMPVSFMSSKKERVVHLTFECVHETDLEAHLPPARPYNLHFSFKVKCNLPILQSHTKHKPCRRKRDERKWATLCGEFHFHSHLDNNTGNWFPTSSNVSTYNNEIVLNVLCFILFCLSLKINLSL